MRLVNSFRNLLNRNNREILACKEMIVDLKQQQLETARLLSDVNHNIDTLSRHIMDNQKRLDLIDSSFTHLNIPHNNRRNILIVGFFGAFNLGDELMLETMIDYHKITQPTTHITIMVADNYSFDVTRYGAHSFIHYPNTPLELNMIAEYYDAIIFPGGAIIDDVGYGLGVRPLTLGTILVDLSLRFITLKKPSILYGLSTNRSLANPEFLQKINAVINGATHFSLRDSNSLLTLERAGVDTKKISIVDDIVLCNKKILKTVEPIQNQTGLIYIYTPETLPTLVQFTKKILDSLGDIDQVKLILFYDFGSNDLKYAQQLLKDINDPRLSIDSEHLGDFEKTIESLGKNSTIFSMRYHGILLSNAIGTRVICIDYDKHSHYYNKNKYIYEHYGFTKNYTKFSELDVLNVASIKKLMVSKVTKVNIEKTYAKARKTLLDILSSV